MENLSTGSRNIDRLLGGGFPAGQISLVYGEASTGKTILSMHCALEAASNDFKTLYVDADQSFSPHKLEHLPRAAQLAERIILFRPEDFRDQVKIVENIESMLTKRPSLLVVDSITGLYRSSDGKPDRFFARNRELNRQLAYLNDLAPRFPLWILLTGQVHSSPVGGDWIVEPVATRTLRHWSSLIIRLQQTPRTDVRECILEKRDGIDVSRSRVLFRIGEDGIEDV
jgi:DNA repair protein RadB